LSLNHCRTFSISRYAAHDGRGITNVDTESTKIEYRTQGRLSDSLKLQLRCSFYFLRYLWVVAAIMLIVLLALDAMSLWPDPWAILMPVAAGLIAGTLTAPLVLIVRRLFRKPAEIRADIRDEGIKIIGNQGFSYEANWQNLTWIKDGASAYVMKFGKLFVRLPKRGFVNQQEQAFRNLVRANAPASALKWKT
jgi:hypothetical protein